MSWQPIETAPKDGTRILIHTRRGEVYIAKFDSGFTRVPWHLGGTEWLAAESAAHWMPLPEPPGVSESGNQTFSRSDADGPAG